MKRRPTVTWSVACDRCDGTLSVASWTDRQAIEQALYMAGRLGWLIAPDRFIRQRDDLCQSCRKDNR